MGYNLKLNHIAARVLAVANLKWTPEAVESLYVWSGHSCQQEQEKCCKELRSDACWEKERQ